ncbi:hypothetical protein RI129_007202 [Pyrocoelia pectoralis]|uniref:N-acetyltransferase domain-containing protein n=1 Tax=Pyrocoelia pectoralis TaxID=417401 RepID=A0AAN7ZIB9_9COLE
MAKVQYEIRVAFESEADSVAEFLNNYFYGWSPLTEISGNANGSKSDILLPSVTLKNSTIVKEGLSIIAVSDTGEIIGASINETLNSEPVSSIYEIALLVSTVNDVMNEKRKAKKEMLSGILVVHPDWRGNGIAGALLSQAIELAKEKKFDQIRCHCTNAYSARVYEKCGFEYIHSIRYEDYKIDDKVVFKPRSPHTHIHGMALRLDN